MPFLDILCVAFLAVIESFLLTPIASKEIIIKLLAQLGGLPATRVLSRLDSSLRPLHANRVGATLTLNGLLEALKHGRHGRFGWFLWFDFRLGLIE